MFIKPNVMKKAILILSILFFQCSQNKIDPTNKLIGGVWVFEKYTTNTDETTDMFFKRKSKFGNVAPSYKFEKNLVLTSLQNSSFCGTPPVMFTEEKGIWNENQATISMKPLPWIKDYFLRYKLIEVNDTELVLKIVNKP